MSRLLWIVGEIVFGLLVSGGVAALVVPVTRQVGWDTGPWVLWVCIAASLIVTVIAGERFWARLKGDRVA